MTAATSSSVETPSGKDATYENFPVGSWLLPRKLRPHIAMFYAFARAIDDIADNPGLPADEKVARLDGFEDAVLGRDHENPAFGKAHAMRKSLAETGIAPRHCLDLLAAFKQDATKLRYRDWDDLLGYCVLSAAPVGRYLLDLHGGSRDGYGPSDALCMALQVINHVQDCQDDYRGLDRVYLPMEWMQQAGAAVEELDAAAASPAMRRVLDQTLQATQTLMNEARALPSGLKSRRLSMESAFIINIADALISLLGRRDPLSRRVELSKAGFVLGGLKGVLSVLF
ncbi:MAG: squalene synthase HpnC [Rhodospirillales bacterium]